MRNPEELEDILNYKFTNRSLLQEALIHSSLLNESRSPELVSTNGWNTLAMQWLGSLLPRSYSP
jgi:dsRNA-specific ribonuclease